MMHWVDEWGGYATVLWCLGLHFIFSSVLVWAGYSLTSTISSGEHGHGTRRLSYWVAFWSGVVLHVLEDYLIGEF
jgi:hypothetical protein